MTARPLVLWPDARLSRRCAEVADEDVSGLIEDMFDTMYAAKGRGLAAPQIGVMKRVFVMDAGWKDGAPAPLACVNPVVSGAGDVVDMDEMCLSVPGLVVLVTRPAAVSLIYEDAATRLPVSISLTGAEARIAQHEADHLDGLLHLDRIEADLRADLLARYEDRP
ncbi:peptide deformylase [Tropicibacter alexandrii]|uniref:peptide deformylase n=1 Tax=Tropicibacter alexandrii TaxID=2267683 RepID=UPI000EF4AF49|nr:peptide deformylase [Tropicibacter alexandrii]